MMCDCNKISDIDICSSTSSVETCNKCTLIAMRARAATLPVCDISAINSWLPSNTAAGRRARRDFGKGNILKQTAAAHYVQQPGSRQRCHFVPLALVVGRDISRPHGTLCPPVRCVSCIYLNDIHVLFHVFCEECVRFLSLSFVSLVSFHRKNCGGVIILSARPVHTYPPNKHTTRAPGMMKND